MTNKELVIQAMHGLPEEATFEEILDRIETLAEIRQGQKDIEEGRFITQEELDRRAATWISK